ncbi:related to histone-lysine N-methyltransferase [Rhynchosporium graminicola]|uniref:Related to histone-lysine N-methyltransferase n=1 Tax=Rhynchosporium graminicola TaxID=2792576 RepID=A0A1E1L261_9HELO|nr:related to histone-lysine N-methyltransferase [Rhynchosporium commune]
MTDIAAPFDLEDALRSQLVTPAPEMARASSADSIASIITVDNASNAQSSSSTPPTSIGDSVSVSSSSLKLEDGAATPAPDTTGRSRRQRANISTYNVKILSGTAIHAPKKFSKDPIIRDESVSRRRTISGDTLLGSLASANGSAGTLEKTANRIVQDGVEALDLQWSTKALTKSKSRKSLKTSPRKTAKQRDLERRKSSRPAGDVVQSLTKKLSVLGKRSRQTLDEGLASSLAGLAKAKRELRNLADTNEFAKIDTQPVLHEVWSNGKLVKPENPRQKKKAEQAALAKEKEKEQLKLKEEEAKLVEESKPIAKRQKVWLTKGLYAGQQGTRNTLNWFHGSSENSKRDGEEIAPFKPSSFMPLPMWHGQRLLHDGRDFKLPFDICSPLPPGQPKPDEWRKTSSNRFVGEAAALWKKSSLFDSFSSKCVCKPEGGCDDDCQNRIMLYECDDTNCGAGRAHCSNRAFATLQERRKAGGKYRIGVEVIKTADRGYGVRSNRCFEANQIIVEYTGEIITEDECDRRMNEDYKHNECYYLMSFDQNMIIDATKGSIARFVNHSCKPNSRMVKWIVGGKPRMALFAGDNPIMTGDELTYDYNFDPFSAKNVQECRCGSDNCRGVLGPKPKPNPKELKAVNETIKAALKSGVKAGKRKLKELLGANEADGADARSPKKRKIKEATGVKNYTSSASIKMAKGAAKAVKKSVSSQLVNARKTITAKRVIKKTMKADAKPFSNRKTTVSPSKSSLTVVAMKGSPRSAKKSPIVKKKVPKIVRSARGNKTVSRMEMADESDDNEGTIRVVSSRDE